MSTSIQWVCSQLFYHCPDPKNPAALDALKARIGAEYQKKFPQAPSLSETLAHCHRERERLLRQIQEAQGELQIPSSGIDYSALIRKTLCCNRQLINSSLENADTVSNRAGYANALSNAAFWLEGRSLDASELADEISAIQQHLVHRTGEHAELFCRKVDPYLLCLFQALSLSVDGTQPPDARQKNLFGKVQGIREELRQTDRQSLLLEIEFQLAASFACSREELWPDLIGKEALLEELIPLAFPDSSYLSNSLIELANWLEILEEVNQTLSQPFKPEDPAQHLLNLLETFGVPSAVALHLKNWVSSQPKKEALHAPSLKEQLRSYLSAHETFKQTYFRVPPSIEELIRLFVGKSLVDYPEESKIERGTRVTKRVFSLFESLEQTPEEKLPLLCRHFAMQGILALGEPSLLVEPLFDRASSLYQCVAKQFQTTPSPRLCRKEIVERAVNAYFDRYQPDPATRDLCAHWADHYFAHRWFNPAPSSQHVQIPTLALFLRWHAIQWLNATPEISRAELSRRLKAIAERELPDFPIEEEIQIALVLDALKKS